MQIGIFGILTLIFVICKLAGVIAWSWLWVFSPLLAGFALSVLLILGIFGAGIGLVLADRPRRRRA